MERKAKVLIVDDNEDHLLLLERLLATSGYEAIKATSGRDAIVAAKRERPDMVLLDLAMPELDGAQTCEIMRRDPANDSLPIVMITLKEKVSDVVRALQAGADDYVFKSAGRDELINRIEVLLSMAKTGNLPSRRNLRERANKADMSK